MLVRMLPRFDNISLNKSWYFCSKTFTFSVALRSRLVQKRFESDVDELTEVLRVMSSSL